MENLNTKILDMFAKSNKNDSTLVKEIGLRNSTITEWRKERARPSAEALYKIANYFKVSTDYLYGLTDDPQPKEQNNPKLSSALATRNLTLNDVEKLSDEQLGLLADMIKNFNWLFIKYWIYYQYKEIYLMTVLNAYNLQKNLSKYINDAVELNEIITITTDNGNAVILNEDDYKSIVETSYLNSIHGLADTLISSMNADQSEFVEIDWRNEL